MKFYELDDDFRGWIIQTNAINQNPILVGDVNQLGGVCDDCKGIRRDDDIEILEELELPKGWR